MGYRTADASCKWDRCVVEGLAGDQRIGMGFAQGDKFGKLGEIMLAVGIDLQRMSESRPPGEIESVRHGSAFSVIGIEAMNEDSYSRVAQSGESGTSVFV